MKYAVRNMATGSLENFRTLQSAAEYVNNTRKHGEMFIIYRNGREHYIIEPFGNVSKVNPNLNIWMG